MDINKDAYLKFADGIKAKIDETVERLIEGDKNQIYYFKNLYHIASSLGVDKEYYNGILDFITPNDVEKEIRRIKRENNLRITIKRIKDDEDKANWIITKTDGDLLFISLTKRGDIFCDGAGCSTIVALPEEMEWFIKEWESGISSLYM